MSKPSVHPDQLKRESIPQHSDLGTDYEPLGNYLMVIPIPDPEKIGEIILPERAKIQQCEGHIVAVGEGVPTRYEVGDFVTWGMHHEIRMSTESEKTFCCVPYTAAILIIKKAKLVASAARRAESDNATGSASV